MWRETMVITRSVLSNMATALATLKDKVAYTYLSLFQTQPPRSKSKKPGRCQDNNNDSNKGKDVMR
jgi:hypothetical protein